MKLTSPEIPYPVFGNRNMALINTDLSNISTFPCRNLAVDIPKSVLWELLRLYDILVSASATAPPYQSGKVLRSA